MTRSWAATLARAITDTVSREGLREFYDPHDGRGMGAQDFAWSALAQNSAGPPRTTFEDRPAVTLANDQLELTILTTGGALATLVRRDDAGKLSPYWNPLRMARELGATHAVSSLSGAKLATVRNGS